MLEVGSIEDQEILKLDIKTPKYQRADLMQIDIRPQDDNDKVIVKAYEPKSLCKITPKH